MIRLPSEAWETIGVMIEADDYPETCNAFSLMVEERMLFIYLLTKARRYLDQAKDDILFDHEGIDELKRDIDSAILIAKGNK